jgi:hypothetical protein
VQRTVEQAADRGDENGRVEQHPAAAQRPARQCGQDGDGGHEQQASVLDPDRERGHRSSEQEDGPPETRGADHDPRREGQQEKAGRVVGGEVA